VESKSNEWKWNIYLLLILSIFHNIGNFNFFFFFHYYFQANKQTNKQTNISSILDFQNWYLNALSSSSSKISEPKITLKRKEDGSVGVFAKTDLKVRKERKKERKKRKRKIVIESLKKIAKCLKQNKIIMMKFEKFIISKAILFYSFQKNYKKTKSHYFFSSFISFVLFFLIFFFF